MPGIWETYYHVIVVIVISLTVFLVPALRRSGLYTAVAAAGAAGIYGNDIIGYALIILVLYGLLLCIDVITSQGKNRAANPSQLRATTVGTAPSYGELAEAPVSAEPFFNGPARWKYSAALMFTTVALFLLASWWFPSGAHVQVASIRWNFRFFDMWFLLRTLSFVWEYGSGETQLERIPFFTWMILPCTVYGPLLRFRDFREQYSASVQRPAVRPVLGRGWWRILALAFVQIGVSLSFKALDSWVAGHYTIGRAWNGFITFGIGPLGFYFSTAGRYHIMECCGCFWGLTLPQSFDNPIGQPNIAEFWKRWNMSATSFFRDHFFFNRWGLERPNLYLNSVVLFTFMGLWHAVNWHWALYGLMHGIAFSVFIWWRGHRNAPLIRRFTLPPSAANIMSRVGTYAFICAATIAPSKLIRFWSTR